MGEPLKKIESGNNIVWVTQPINVKNLIKRRGLALNIAKGKTSDSGKIETAMQTAEAFGRGLFEEFVKENAKEWTMDEWVKPVVKNVFNPLGTGATFTKITDEEARSFVFTYMQNEEDSNDPNMSSLFNYGFLRGMLLSAFPNGELIMESSMIQGAAMDKFIFKANATEEDKIERERIKKSFTTGNVEIMIKNE